MATRTFAGGIHPPEYKEQTNSLPVEQIDLPQQVIIPLHQHTGAPCTPKVNVGESVTVGQVIGDSDAFISAPVHSSVAGHVVAIEPLPYFNNTRVLSVVIEVEGDQVWVPDQDPLDYRDINVEDIRQAVRQAGVVGLGGAAFPTHVKLTPPKNKPIDSVIINGCECEPYLTCDHRIMLERPQDVVLGANIARKAVGASKVYIGIETNKPDAIRVMQEVAGEEQDMEVVPLEVKYPEGAEKQLIKAVLDRRVPPGKLPSEVGALVQNVGTAVAIAEAVTLGKPLFERVLTVTGPCIAQPKNLKIRIGTPVSHVLEQCGGFSQTPRKVIMGGPMTGWAQSSLDVPVVKGTSGIVALPESMVSEAKWHNCVRCGKCVKACPMFLLPNFIGMYAEAHNYDKAEKFDVLDCFECGACAYVCPSRRPLVQFFRNAKAEIMARRRRA